MRPFEAVRSTVAPLERVNVDTDQIVPKQFLKLVQRSGFGRHLFHDWRYDADGRPRPDFVLNDPRYAGSRILAAGENFGCGSSREHAVWALLDYGFEVIVAPSFADIFLGNCTKNGVLAVRLAGADMRRLVDAAGEVTVDLEAQEIRTESGAIPFEVGAHRRQVLLEGLDEVARTLRLEDEIARYERASRTPSVF